MSDENIKKIENVLKKNEMLKSAEIAEMIGIDKKEVDKIIKKLKDEGKIVSPKRCYYSLK